MISFDLILKKTLHSGLQELELELTLSPFRSTLSASGLDTVTKGMMGK